jgi:internalin A
MIILKIKITLIIFAIILAGLVLTACDGGVIENIQPPEEVEPFLAVCDNYDQLLNDDEIEYILIKGVQYNTSLIELDLSRMQLRNEDIVPLRHMTNLRSLNLWANQISDITPLSGLANLTWLDLSENQIRDISPLSNLTNLTNNLNLWGNRVEDVTLLSNFTNLTQLSVGRNPIGDITPIFELTNLKSLNLGGLRVSDLMPLSGFTNLIHLWVGRDHLIEDWSPVEHVWWVDYRDR